NAPCPQQGLLIICLFYYLSRNIGGRRQRGTMYRAATSGVRRDSGAKGEEGHDMSCPYGWTIASCGGS
ncbi:MAG: hypothetical protein WBE13_14760, partial [Candidatus Acidiferrum sp.]